MEKIPFIYNFSRFWLWVGLRIWNRYRASGKENVPAQGGIIIASNHASYLDPPLLGCALKHRYVRFLARDSLFQNRLGQWWANKVGVVFIDRNRGDLAAFKAALTILKAGGALCLFPEGTRTLDGNLQSPKAGIGFLIVKSAVPVVPAYIEGSFAAFSKGAGRIRPAKITVRYGQPISPEEFQRLGSDKTAYHKAAALVMEKIAALRPNPDGA
ncbi:MAG: lysophospholipid acyltransferase family protein [Kiritimatiellia bacterium]|nr:lysophospholipid acyltransferase family protein [Kiritimatiellia bacterium]